MLGVTLAAAAHGKPLFSMLEFPTPGRTKAVEIADLDGDGRADIFEIAFVGLPPDEKRELRIRYQSPSGSLSRKPDWTGNPLDNAVTYDLANLDSAPGSELVLMRPDRITVLSFAGRELSRSDIPLAELPLLTVWPDERGLDHLDMVRDDLGPELRLLIPLFGEAVVLGLDGELDGRLAVGGRANYFVPAKTVPMLTENEIEIYFDHPRINTGDVNGDGLRDLIVSNRHEIRVFPQTADGSFESEPGQILALRMISESDHIQRSGTVRTETGDFNGDGRTDLLISHTSGGIFDAKSEALVFVNRGGTWDLSEPDQRWFEEGSVSRNLLLDLDGDGRFELIHVRVPLGVLEAVEVLLTRAIDAYVTIHRANDDGTFSRDPMFTRKLDLAISLERQSSLGFVPTLDADLNGDGFRDLFDSGGGEAVEVYLGGAKKPFRNRVVQKDVETGGRVLFGDLNSDGLMDFAIYDPRRPDSDLRVGINLGNMPGTPAAEPGLVPAGR